MRLTRGRSLTSFFCLCSGVSTPCVEGTILYSWNGLGTLVKSSWPSMHGFISGLYMSSRWLLFPPLRFDYCCFVKRFENKKYKISNIVVLQYLLENRLFHFYMKGHLDVGKITSNLWIGLSGMDLLKILYSNLRVQTRNLFINFSQLIYQNL